jgi:hypothetical protein
MECKGFWNMCGCDSCKQQDRELVQKLDTGTPEDRRAQLCTSMREMFEHYAKKDVQ